MADLVTLRNPDGELQAFNASDVPLLLERKYTIPSNEEIQRHNDIIDQGGFLGGAKAFTEAGLSAATFGLSREAENALGLSSPYEQAIRKEAHPVAAGLGTAAGIVAPIVASLGTATPEALAAGAVEAGGEALGAGAAKTALGAADILNPVAAVGKVGSTISEAAAPQITKALGGLSQSMPATAQAISKGGAGALAGSAEGALYGLGNQIDEHALGDPEALGEHLMAGIGNGMLFGGTLSGALGVAAPFAKKAMQGLKDTSIFKKGLSVISGVPEEQIDAYLKNREAINATPEFREFYDRSLDHVQGIFDQVAAGEIGEKEAQEAFKRLESGLSEDLKQNKWEARQAVLDAKRIVGTAVAEHASALQKGGLDAAPRITEAVERLRQKVVDQSQGAYKILDESGAKIDLNSFIDKAKEIIEKARQEYHPDAEATAKRLEDYVQFVKDQAEKIPEAEAKHGAEIAEANKYRDEIISQISSIDTEKSSLKFPEAGARYDIDNKVTRLPGYTAGDPAVLDVMDELGASKAEMKELQKRLKDDIKLTPKQSEIYEALKKKNFEYMNPEQAAAMRAKELADEMALFFDDTEFSKSLEEKGAKELEKFEGVKPEYNPFEQVKKPFNGVVPARSVKSMIQGLDRLSKYDFNAASFDKGMSLYYKQLRRVLDQELKETVPEYAAAMKPLAKDTELLSKLGKYGEEARSIRAVSAVKSKANQMIELPLLRELEAKAGGAFMRDIEGFVKTADRKALMKALPEYADLAKAQEVLTHLNNPETEKAFYEALEKTPEFRKLTEAQKRLAEAEIRKASLDGLTPRNLETKLKASMRGKFNVENAIRQLPDIEGVPMEEALQNLRTKEAFEGGHAIGSRAVNLGGALGSALGMATGHLVGGIGYGAAIGAYMDKYGHQAAKSILDAYLGAGEKAAVMGNVLKQVERNNKEISSMARNVFGGAVKAIPQVAIKAGATDYKPEVFQHIDELANNPEKLQQGLETNTAGLEDHIPQISMNANMQSVRAAKFLSAKIPHGTNRILSAKYKPSRSEMMKFHRYYNTVKQPMGVMKRIKTGMVLPEEMETLKTVYPQLLNQMQGAIMEELAGHMAEKKALPYQTKLGLSAFLEQPLVNSLDPKAIAANQATFAAPSMQKEQGLKPTQKGLASLNSSGRFQTGYKKLSAGTEA